jgi:thiosulfate/3-mercaptopyruvate sulfurtransferase
VAGHIPGAHNTPMADYVPDGRFLDPEHLHAYFAACGVFDHGEVGAYCGSGITAAHLALALRRVGILAPVYVGSWSEWITDPARPIATGAAVTDQ